MDKVITTALLIVASMDGVALLTSPIRRRAAATIVYGGPGGRRIRSRIVIVHADAEWHDGARATSTAETLRR